MYLLAKRSKNINKTAKLNLCQFQKKTKLKKNKKLKNKLILLTFMDLRPIFVCRQFFRVFLICMFIIFFYIYIFILNLTLQLIFKRINI